MSGHYVRGRHEGTTGAIYNISYAGESEGTVLMRPDGSACFFGNAGEEINEPKGWLAAVDEWRAWNPGVSP